MIRTILIWLILCSNTQILSALTPLEEAQKAEKKAKEFIGLPNKEKKLACATFIGFDPIISVAHRYFDLWKNNQTDTDSLKKAVYYFNFVQGHANFDLWSKKDLCEAATVNLEYRKTFPEDKRKTFIEKALIYTKTHQTQDQEPATEPLSRATLEAKAKTLTETSLETKEDLFTLYQAAISYEALSEEPQIHADGYAHAIRAATLFENLYGSLDNPLLFIPILIKAVTCYDRFFEFCSPEKLSGITLANAGHIYFEYALIAEDESIVEKFEKALRFMNLANEKLTPENNTEKFQESLGLVHAKLAQYALIHSAKNNDEIKELLLKAHAIFEKTLGAKKFSECSQDLLQNLGDTNFLLYAIDKNCTAFLSKAVHYYAPVIENLTKKNPKILTVKKQIHYMLYGLFTGEEGCLFLNAAKAHYALSIYSTDDNMALLHAKKAYAYYVAAIHDQDIDKVEQSNLVEAGDMCCKLYKEYPHIQEFLINGVRFFSPLLISKFGLPASIVLESAELFYDYAIKTGNLFNFIQASCSYDTVISGAAELMTQHHWKIAGNVFYILAKNSSKRAENLEKAKIYAQKAYELNNKDKETLALLEKIKNLG